MNVVVIGSGYVGLVTGCCLAEAGHKVVCVEHDAQKMSRLETGRVPFHEPGLQALLQDQLQAGGLIFASGLADAMDSVDVVFLTVGTPMQPGGEVDLRNLVLCVRELSSTALVDSLVVVKSTVPVGMGDMIEQLLNDGSPQRRVRVVSNPEFLAEGRAVRDFRHPERIVIGANDAGSASIMADLYAPFDPDGRRMIFTDRRSAEFAKYACNAMLAARISMVNELSGLASGVGADMQAVCRVLKADPRIGARYLHPGVGYGGSCLPKALHAFIHMAQNLGEPAHMLRSTQQVNQRQGLRLLTAIRAHFEGELRGRRIAIWGLAFKPGTDDVRAAPSLALIRSLVEEGALVSAYDPVAMGAARLALGKTRIGFSHTAAQACVHADALVLMTEWDEFKRPDFAQIARSMKGNMVFDARAVYDTATLHRHGLQHFHLGRRSPQAVGRSAPDPAEAGQPKGRESLLAS